jgi:2-dehydropantoate 2-reductase
MRIAIIGPGAVGCLYAAYLGEAGHEVTLLDHRAERARRLAIDGIAVNGVRGRHQVRVKVVAAAAEVSEVELILVCVKATQTQRALEMHRALFDRPIPVWSLQNGFGIAETLTETLGARRVLGGGTTMGCELIDPGTVKHTGEGHSVVGEWPSGTSDRVERIAHEFTVAGVAVVVSQNVQWDVWLKLLVNAAINPLGALLALRNGELLQHGNAQRLIQAVVGEGVAVARSRGLIFEPADVLARVKEVAAQTAANRSSMFVDLAAGRQTEIDYINGAIARLGNAPCNQALTELIHAVERRTEGEDGTGKAML